MPTSSGTPVRRSLFEADPAYCPNLSLAYETFPLA